MFGSFPIFAVLFLLLAVVIAFGVPGAYLVAIFRYGLWDLDVVVRKAVVYVVLAILLLVTGFAFVWFVTGLFASAAAPNGKVDLLSGVVVGLLFWPLRKIAVKIADRFVYGGRATPYEVLTSFAGRVGETYSTDDILPRMVQVLAKGVGAEGATVWLRVGNELRPAMTWPDDAPAPASVASSETRCRRSPISTRPRFAIRASSWARSPWSCRPRIR